MTSLAVPSSCIVTHMTIGTQAVQDVDNPSFPRLLSNGDRGRIEIDHLYGLCCLGWYCYPAQLMLCPTAVPTTPAQTVSWSISIFIHKALHVTGISIESSLPRTFFTYKLLNLELMPIECCGRIKSQMGKKCVFLFTCLFRIITEKIIIQPWSRLSPALKNNE